MKKLALAFLLAAALALAACTRKGTSFSDESLLREGTRFVSDDAYRRAALEHSLVNPENLYSKERLSSYGLGDRGWDLLPEWNPRSKPVDAAMAAKLERGEMPSVREDAPVWDGITPTTMPEWVALGRRVFTSYPMRAEIFMEFALTKPDFAREIGVERTADGSVPGLVVFSNVDGHTRVGITCALCHSTVRADGVQVIGSARRHFDYGRLRVRYFADTGDPVDPELVRRMKEWGPGRADVTEDNDVDPVTIPDLWGVRSQSFLTQTGAIRNDSPLALAIRQETQLTDSNHLLVRPPRVLAYALAMFVDSLEPPADPPRAPTAELSRGAALFSAYCATYHSNAAHGGAAIDVAAIGTDPALATGHGRGTDHYRTPPLVRVRDGAPYLHDGSVSSLEELLSPERLRTDYRAGRLGPGAVPGHRAGTELDTADRAALISYLRTL